MPIEIRILVKIKRKKTDGSVMKAMLNF